MGYIQFVALFADTAEPADNLRCIAEAEHSAEPLAADSALLIRKSQSDLVLAPWAAELSERY
jgi:hypothetical protein